jgi:hypothetical protein
MIARATLARSRGAAPDNPTAAPVTRFVWAWALGGIAFVVTCLAINPFSLIRHDAWVLRGRGGHWLEVAFASGLGRVLMQCIVYLPEGNEHKYVPVNGFVTCVNQHTVVSKIEHFFGRYEWAPVREILESEGWLWPL